MSKYVSYLGFIKSQTGLCASSSAHSTGGIFTPLPPHQSISLTEHKNFLLQKVFKTVIQPTLLDVFYLICEHKTKTETLKDYLFRQSSPPSNGQYKSFFNKGQIEKIDKNPSGDEYDMSLFFACFPLIAGYNSKLKINLIDVDKLKDILKKMKDPRNHLAHDLLSLPEAIIDQFAMHDLKLYMSDFLDLIGTIFGCQSATDARKILVDEHIDRLMATQKRDFDNKYVYILGSLLVISGIVHLKHFMKI